MSDSFFTSPRERRLWLFAGAAIAAIFATIGLASTLSRFAYSQGIAAVAFLGAMAMVAATVLTQGLRFRPRGLEIGLMIGVAVVYFMLLFRLTIPERSHLIEYGVVAVFVFEALLERAGHARRVPVPALLAIIMTTAVGAADEAIQLLIPSRVFDPVDILFNFLAAVMAVVSMVILRWGRKRVEWARGRDP